MDSGIELIPNRMRYAPRQPIETHQWEWFRGLEAHTHTYLPQIFAKWGVTGTK